MTALLARILMAIGLGLALVIYFAATLTNRGVPPAELSDRLMRLTLEWFASPLFSVGYRAADLLIILAIVFAFRRWVDHRSFRSLGLQLTRGWWRELLAGFALALTMWVAIFGASLALGAVAVIGFAWESRDGLAMLGALGAGLLMHLMVGVAEETDARGYVLQNLAEGMRFASAVVISSVYFGMLHFLNPGAGLGSAIGIFIAGVLLAMGYYATGRLWFSIGLHAAWNWAQGPIFGFLVSGLEAEGLVRLRVIGPEWLMGGAFGPEAGALAMGVEIVTIGALWLWARRE